MVSNFSFLEKDWEQLARIGEMAESVMYKDPNTSIMKLRQFSEELVKNIFILENLDITKTTEAYKRISILKRYSLITNDIEDIENRKTYILDRVFKGVLTSKWRKENVTSSVIELLESINEEKIRLWEQECINVEKEGKKKPKKPQLKSIEEMLVPKEEQPYELPENWEWVRLGDITSVISGGTPKTNIDTYYLNGTIPWITPKDLSGYKEKYISFGDRNITEEGLNNSSARLMPKNTLLLSSRALIGYVAISNNEVTTNQGFKSFIPSICYNSEYLYYYLKSSKEYL